MQRIGSGLDYHVGVVSTDLDNPLHSGILRSAYGYLRIDIETVDPDVVFWAMSMMGTTGSGYEMGSGAAYLALGPLASRQNVGIQRPDSKLHTIVISDEADQTLIITVDEFIAWYDVLRPDGDSRFHGILSNSSIAADYYQIIGGVGGVTASIYDLDYAPILDKIGIDIVGAGQEFFLSTLPVVRTIEVKLETLEDNTIVFDRHEWTYSTVRNSITFRQYMPQELDTVVITYKEAL